jgi:hypothetical protein
MGLGFYYSAGDTASLLFCLRDGRVHGTALASGRFSKLWTFPFTCIYQNRVELVYHTMLAVFGSPLLK